MTNNFNLHINEDDTEKLLEVFPEELTNEELLELEQKCIAEKEAKEIENAGKDKEEPPTKFTIKWLAEAFTELNKLLESLKTWTPTPKVFH